MAFNAKKIFPIDTKARQAVGVSLPFSGKAVFNNTFLTKDAIRSNLINFFLTEPGERYENPTYGGGLRSFIFEQLTNENFDFLKEDISQKIASFFPSVAIGNIEVLDNPSRNEIIINIVYDVVDTGITDTIEIAFPN
ncbi:GPW/gp25 family protein [Haliea sp.]|jgi:phage baseplate assembly protein W|uniref:GPW/gp25 family protein n=1 Tax=Haliea sp. TaxID=1932666 RepID=UPI000C469291|nr:GPW/gp25 family protein [Haliea sp.]MAD65725.1 hypothetical protein [Haliea sp.]|tara:strand:+ start:75 stop:485 length:411 start_codon:yes stop_codon:yes gene_type:complete